MRMYVCVLCMYVHACVVCVCTYVCVHVHMYKINVYKAFRIFFRSDKIRGQINIFKNIQGAGD